MLNKLLFLLLDLKDLGFNGVFGDELIDVNILFLADAIDSVYSLAFDPFLPPSEQSYVSQGVVRSKIKYSRIHTVRI